VSRKVFEPARDETVVKTYSDLLKVVENELGWCAAWDDPRPPWKIRATEVSKLKRVIQKLERENVSLRGKFTIENLLVVVEYLKREKDHIKSPVYLAYALERSLEWYHDQRLGHLEERVERAKRQVSTHLEGIERETWMRKLTRARGDQLVELITEWEGFIA